jgi:hypothetical protein
MLDAASVALEDGRIPLGAAAKSLLAFLCSALVLNAAYRLSLYVKYC